MPLKPRPTVRTFVFRNFYSLLSLFLFRHSSSQSRKEHIRLYEQAVKVPSEGTNGCQKMLGE